MNFQAQKTKDGRMLVLSRKETEALLIGENIEISIVEIKGKQVKLAVKAPKEVKILRAELTNSDEKKPSVVFKKAA